MREIYFRGKDIDGNWREGDLIWATLGQGQKPMILDAFDECDIDNNLYEVDPDTVGQFTGLKDISDAEIYEGDIVSFKDDETDECVRGLVTQSVEGTWWVVCDEFRVPLWNVRKTTLIMSNVHDNPGLLEQNP